MQQKLLWVFLFCFFDAAIGQQTQTVVQNQIGFAVFDFFEGDPKDNVPIIYFHGTSSSKIEPYILLEQIKEKKRTVIAFDRPGYGDTRYVEFDSLDDYVLWFKQQLLPNLESVLGFQPVHYDLVSVSGGALFSLRAACAVPERVRKVSVLSAGLFGRPVGGEGRYEKTRRFVARRPLATKIIMRAGNRNLDILKSISAQRLSEPDKVFADSHAELGKQVYIDATKCGVAGIVQDARLQLYDTSYAMPLPKQVMVEIWNGDRDNTISLESARLLSKGTGVALNVIRNEGHISSLPIAFKKSVRSAKD
ncbi:MAG: alpha/beta hydrolase [Planctomycetota bacterium]|nr:alpha/beta hydrolase [Planctomycetota bacterium]